MDILRTTQVCDFSSPLQDQEGEMGGGSGEGSGKTQMTPYNVYIPSGNIHFSVENLH